MRFFFLIFGFGISGAIALGIAVHVGRDAWRLRQDGLRATALVVEMMRDREDGFNAAPKFRFQDAQGAEHTVASHFYRHPPAYRVGDSVAVIYERSNPEHASIESFANLWMLPLFVGGAGGLFVFVSGLLLLGRVFLGRR